jgi:CRISPR/Cas system-associated exonuclease Cas4 (RecB family)
VRVIGTFSSPEYLLTLDDNREPQPNKCSMIIVEPLILIPTTQIVKTYPCVRRAYLSHQFKSSSDINYALVLGNIVHEVFQQILKTMDFRKQTLEATISKAV